MEKIGISKIAKNLGGVISKNSPTILTTLAVGGLVTTVIFAVRATPKALFLLDEARFMRGEYNTEPIDDLAPLSKLEIVKCTWKCYVPAACMGLATIACIIGSNSINQRRTAALASVYGLTEIAFREYKEKVVETIGKSKELKVRDEISADHVRQNPPGANEVIITGRGEVLCYDSYSGRYFKSDIENIRKIENNLNKLLYLDDHISLNELYIDLGLAPVKMGEDLGWSIQTGMLEFRFSSTLTPDTNEPCLVIDYEVRPKFEY